jgi:uncharacterized protein
MSPAAAVLSIALAVVGSLVQGSIGFGFGVLIAPLLAMIDPEFVPGGILVAVLPLSLWVAATSTRHVNTKAAALAVSGRIPGAFAGAAVVSVLSERMVALGLAAAVLVAVALSVWSSPFRVTSGSTVVAGTTSGFMGTATGVGGPPLALLFQRSEPHMVRATLAVVFTIGTAISIGALALAGEFTARQFRLGVMLIPGVVAGLVASHRLRHWFLGPHFRPLLLATCSVSAVVLAVQQLT